MRGHIEASQQLTASQQKDGVKGGALEYPLTAPHTGLTATQCSSGPMCYSIKLSAHSYGHVLSILKQRPFNTA